MRRLCMTSFLCMAAGTMASAGRVGFHPNQYHLEPNLGQADRAMNSSAAGAGCGLGLEVVRST